VSIDVKPKGPLVRLAAWLRREARAAIAPASAAAVLAATAAAQSQVLTLTGPPNAHIGGRFAAAGDLDGDGVSDDLVSDGSDPGVVVVYSGSDGSQLHAFPSSGLFTGFGWAIAGGHDIDGDAVPDILIGAFNNAAAGWGSGSVFVHSGASWGLIRQHDGSGAQNLGASVAFVGDLDGDGVCDYAAGATHYNNYLPGPEEAGEAYVYSGASGAVIHHLGPGAVGGQFGISLASIGDVDSDGVSDLCIGEPSVDTQGFFLNGKVWIVSGATGLTVLTVEGANDLASYGYRLAAPGDANLDGTPDLVTIAFDIASFHNGAAVLSGASASRLTYIQSPLALASGSSGGVGQFLDTVAALDGNGIREVLVPYYFGGIEIGHALVADAASGEPLYYLQEPPAPSDFPGALANAGDRDGDGRDEIATSRGDNTVTIYTTRTLVATTASIPHATGGAATFDLNAGIPHAGGAYFLIASLTPAGGPACGGMPIGTTVIPLCYDLLTSFSILLVNIPPFVETAGHLDGVDGKGTAAFDLIGQPLPASTIGVAIWFAYIAKDGSEAGGPWTLASNAEPVTVN